MTTFKRETDEERLERYFEELKHMIPNPPKDWQKNMRPCKWAKILEERKNNK